MTTKTPFRKTYSTPRDLVVLLQSRGLTIVDYISAEHYLIFTPLVFAVGTLNLVTMLFYVISFIALGFNIRNATHYRTS